MKIKQLVRVGVAAVATAFMAVGVLASPATASTPLQDEEAIDSSLSIDAPQGVSATDWDSAISEATDKFGTGDKAYLEALKSVAPLSVTYCNDRWSYITKSSGVWRIPVHLSAGPGSQWQNCVMESGLNNIAVSTLQNALNACYGRSLVVDGAFGPATYNALMYAQSFHGIGVDGVYGPITRSVLKFPGGTGCRTYAQIQALM